MNTVEQDFFNLQRFVDAQHGVYETALAELRHGHKQSHWMWFIFPQLAGLGHSAMAQKYGISTLAEARAYLAHPLLGPRLRVCCRLLAALHGRTADEIFGYPDNMKLRSSLTLFDRAGTDNALFRQCLDKYFAGQADPATLALLD